jgi:hypothetical protein
MLTLITVLLHFNFLIVEDNTNLDEQLIQLCKTNSVDYNRDIKAPFDQYLNESGITGKSDGELYINYLKYLTENDQTHTLIDSMNLSRWSLRVALINVDLYDDYQEYVNYDVLIKLLKKTKSKYKFTNDFMQVLKTVKKEKYLVSTGLIASGILLILEDSNLDIVSHQQLVTLTVAAFAVTNGL